MTVGADNKIYGYFPPTGGTYWTSPDDMYHFAITTGGWGVVGSVSDSSWNDSWAWTFTKFSGIVGFKMKHKPIDSGPLNKDFRQPPEKDPIQEMLEKMREKAEKIADGAEALMEAIKNLAGGGTSFDLLPLFMPSPCITNPYSAGCKYGDRTF